MSAMPHELLLRLQTITARDVEVLRLAQESYGTSWRNRGGIGAFMMLARKWDRLENQTKKAGYDIFEAISSDQRSEGIIDDLRDLRQYLLLVEEHMIATTALTAQPTKEQPAAVTQRDTFVRIWDTGGTEQEQPFGFDGEA